MQGKKKEKIKSPKLIKSYLKKHECENPKCLPFPLTSSSEPWGSNLSWLPDETDVPDE